MLEQRTAALEDLKTRLIQHQQILKQAEAALQVNFKKVCLTRLVKDIVTFTLSYALTKTHFIYCIGTLV